MTTAAEILAPQRVIKSNWQTSGWPMGATTYTNALPDLLPADTWFRILGSANYGVTVLDSISAGLSNIELVKGRTYFGYVAAGSAGQLSAVISWGHRVPVIVRYANRGPQPARGRGR